VWNRGLELIQDFDLLTLMPTWERLTASLNGLIAEIFPCTTLQLIPEWEETTLQAPQQKLLAGS
jgi:hypothetical protein